MTRWIRFDPLELQSNLFLSPLAGYTNLPFRLVVREIGGALSFLAPIEPNPMQSYGQWISLTPVSAAWPRLGASGDPEKRPHFMA